jgi:hypothetical protein
MQTTPDALITAGTRPSKRLHHIAEQVSHSCEQLLATDK